MTTNPPAVPHDVLAKSFVAQVEKLFGLPQSGGLNVSKDLAEKIIQVMSNLHSKYSDLGPASVARSFDDSALAFADKVVRKEMQMGLARGLKEGEGASPEAVTVYAVMKYLRHNQMLDGTKLRGISPSVTIPPLPKPAEAVRTPGFEQQLKLGREQIAAFEKILGVPASGKHEFTEAATRKLVDVLEGIYARHPDLARSTKSSPHSLDEKTYAFLKKAYEREPLQPDVLGAFAMVRYAQDGITTDGTRLSSIGRPSVAKPWAVPPDKTNLFFGAAVYNEMGIDTTPFNEHKYYGGKFWVSHEALFNPPDPAQKKMIEEAAKAIGLVGVRGKFTDTALDGTKYKQAVIFEPAKNQADSSVMTYYSLDEMARLSREIMIRQAKGICGVEEKGITNAIMTGRYMPSLVDLRLAEYSFGKPANWPQDKLDHLRDIRVIPPGQGDPQREYDIYRHPEVRAHQSAGFAAMFGRADTTYPSPSAYYDPVFRRMEARAYEEDRELRYIPRLEFRAYTKAPLCEISPGQGVVTGVTVKPTPSSTATVVPAAQTGHGTTSSAGAGGAIATGSEQKTGTVCAANEAFLKNGCGSNAGKILDNAQSTTGQAVNKPPATEPCAANAVTPCAKPPVRP